MKSVLLMIWCISIHAPAKGATSEQQVEKYCREISIHAPAKGATILRLNLSVYPIYFNPRSREGSDDIDLDFETSRRYISIHAPAKGVTEKRCTKLLE